MDADPDQPLVERCRQGDGNALRELVERYQADVYLPIVRAVPDRARGERMAEDVFVRIHRELPRYRGQTPVRQWLLRTAAEVCPEAFGDADRRPDPGVVPPTFVVRTVGRIRHERWQREQWFDLAFNTAIALVGLATLSLAWYVLDASGLSTIGSATLDLVAAQMSETARAIAPSLPGYLAAVALLAGVLAAWWWAER